MAVFYPRTVALAISLLSTQGGMAQTAPNAGRLLRELQTPQDLAPPRSGPALKNEEVISPKLSDSDIKFLVKMLRIKGNALISGTALHALVADLEGGDHSLSELNAAAARITAYYRDQGFPVIRAYLPAQEIQDGEVTIMVIEGRVGEQKINNRARLSNERVAAYLDTAKTGEIIRSGPVDRGLLILNDTPGVGSARATLQPGASVGTSDLLVELTPGAAYAGSVDLDNFGNRYVGEYRIGGTLNINSPLQIGDVLSLNVLSSGSGLNYGRVAYQLPIGSDGLRLGAAYADTNYKLAKEFATLDAHGIATSASLFAAYPFIRSQKINLNGALSLEQKKLSDSVGATLTTTDTTSINGALLGGSLSYLTSRNAGSYSAGAGTLTQSGLYSGQFGYDISYANSSASLTIAKANVTLSNTDAIKIYDGSSAAQSSMTITSGQLFGADTAIAQAYTYSDKNVGSNKTVSASGVNVNDGNGGNNYNISYVANSSSGISQASITLSSGDVTKTYDGATSAAGVATVVGGTLFGGDSLSGGSFAFTDKNAGNGKLVTVNGVTVGDGTNNGNYNISYVNNTASVINRASLTVSSSDVTKTYDGTISAAGSAIVVGGTLYGSDILSGGSFAYTDKNAGSGKSVVVSGASAGDGVNNGNYDIAYVNNTASTINRATLTVAANGVNRVYDGTSDAAATYTDNRIQGDQISVSGIASFSDKNVGSSKQVTIGSLQLSGADAQNYVLATNTPSATADITQATLSVTADSISKFYDGNAYAGNGGVTISGLLHGDTQADLAGALSYSGSALGASAVGNYVITPVGLSSGNYRVVFVNGQLSIKPLDQIGQPVQRSLTSVVLGVSGMDQAYDAAIQFRAVNRSGLEIMQPGKDNSFSLPTQDPRNDKDDRSTTTQIQQETSDLALSKNAMSRLILAGCSVAITTGSSCQ